MPDFLCIREKLPDDVGQRKGAGSSSSKLDRSLSDYADIGPSPVAIRLVWRYNTAISVTNTTGAAIIALIGKSFSISGSATAITPSSWPNRNPATAATTARK